MGDVKKGLRTVRNVVHNYNDAQVKVREATSNDPWGPAASLMSDIADMSYNHLAFSDIMQMLWKRMNDSGKDWRHVYKSLVVLDYIIKCGTEKVAQHCKENLYFIQTLQNFQHMEENKDLGMNVREKAKQVVALLTDEERLKNERVKAAKTRERLRYSSPNGAGSVRDHYPPDEGIASSASFSGGLSTSGGGTFSSGTSEMENVRPANLTEEEIQLQIALAMSKEEAEEEERRRQRDDMRLQLALTESQSEYQRAKPVQVTSQDELFDVFHQPAQSGGMPNAADPWGAPDAFGGNSGGDFGASDNFGGSVANDPWSSPATANGTTKTTSLPAMNAAPSNNSGVYPSLDPWSQLTPVSSTDTAGFRPASPSNQGAKKNAAEDFLGNNSSLVNLDALITPTRPAQPVSAFTLNPFGTSTTSTPMSATPNPFHQAQAPAPTMNQLRNSAGGPGGPQPSQFGSFGGLPQPLQPVSNPTLGQQPNRFAQPQANNYNPFL